MLCIRNMSVADAEALGQSLVACTRPHACPVHVENAHLLCLKVPIPDIPGRFACVSRHWFLLEHAVHRTGNTRAATDLREPDCIYRPRHPGGQGEVGTTPGIQYGM